MVYIMVSILVFRHISMNFPQEQGTFGWCAAQGVALSKLTVTLGVGGRDNYKTQTFAIGQVPKPSYFIVIQQANDWGNVVPGAKVPWSSGWRWVLCKALASFSFPLPTDYHVHIALSSRYIVQDIERTAMFDSVGAKEQYLNLTWKAVYTVTQPHLDFLCLLGSSIDTHICTHSRSHTFLFFIYLSHSNIISVVLVASPDGMLRNASEMQHLSSMKTLGAANPQMTILSSSPFILRNSLAHRRVT